MKKRVEELLAGRLKDDGSKLLFSTERISASVSAGEKYAGSFLAYSDDESEVRAFVLSDNGRVKLNREKFSAKRVRIFFEADTAGLEDGDVCSAKILFLTHIGKYVMPVKIRVEKHDLPESYAGVTDLESFAALAEKNFREAFRMFNGDHFSFLMKDAGERIKTLRRGFSHKPVTYQHLEEFMIAAGLKDRIGIAAVKDRFSFYISEDQRENIVLKKNTWGHVDIDVSVKGDFISLSKDHITEDDFLGNTLNFEIMILKSRVGSRRKKGRIVFTTPYQSLEIGIEAESTVDELDPFIYRQSQISNLMRLYIRLKQNRINYRTWYDASMEIINEMKEEEEGGFALYAEMFLCYSKDDNRALIELLWKVKSGKIKAGAPWEKAAYLYFAKQSGLLPEEERNIASKLARCYREEPADYIPLALYLKDSGNDNPARALETLEKAYDSGCNSPLMYIDAWNIIKRRQSLLRRATPFIMHTLYYAQKNGMMLESVLMRAAFLLDGSTDFDKQVFDFLTAGYEQYPGKELLEVICRYIINGTPSRPEYYKWFSLAVESGIRMTRLFEYYMETRPEDDRSQLPLPVKIYFSYSPALGEGKRAYLYALVTENKDKDPVTYENYLETMQMFALSGLKAGRINENFAVLYEEFFSESDDKEVLGALSALMFTHRIFCADPNMRAVAVCHPEAEEESICRITENRAYPDIYTPGACVFLEDRFKRRYAVTVPYTDEQILNTARFAKRCMDAGINTPGMHMYMCFDPENAKNVNGHNLLMYWSAAEDPGIAREYRDVLRRRILMFFLENPRSEAAAPFVEKMKALTYAQIDKAASVELFMKFGMPGRAYEIVSRFGCEKIPLHTLDAVLSEEIRRIDFSEDEELVARTLYAYKAGAGGKAILEYLCRYIITDPDVMDDIRQKALMSGIDTFAIEERIILFMIYIRHTTFHARDIFEHYRDNGGQDILCRAYISFIGLTH